MLKTQICVTRPQCVKATQNIHVNMDVRPLKATQNVLMIHLQLIVGAAYSEHVQVHFGVKAE